MAVRKIYHTSITYKYLKGFVQRTCVTSIMLSPLSPSQLSNQNSDFYFSNSSPASRLSGSSKSYVFDVHINDWQVFAPPKGISFTIMVFADNLSYLVQRTEADFIALDKKLLKHFPTSTPFLAMRVDEKSPKKSPVKPEGMSIEKNMSELNSYLTKLLLKNEIIQSSYFLDFIDERITSPELFLPRKSSSVPNVYDILLSQEDTECTVLRTKEVVFEVPVSSIVLWRFTTVDYDIGFSVDLDGVQKVEFSRVPAHQKVICGSLEVKEPGVCHLKWDNTYSKFHLKTLRFSAASVSPEQYDVACETVNELYKTLKVYDKQRLIVKRCVLKKAAKAGLLHKLSPEEEQEDSSLEVADSLQSDVLNLRAQLAHAQEQLAEAQAYIDELEEGKRIVEEARDQVLDSWKFTLSQLGTAKEDARRLAKENKELVAALKTAGLTESLPRKEAVSVVSTAKEAGRSADDDEVVL